MSYTRLLLVFALNSISIIPPLNLKQKKHCRKQQNSLNVSRIQCLISVDPHKLTTAHLLYNLHTTHIENAVPLHQHTRRSSLINANTPPTLFWPHFTYTYTKTMYLLLLIFSFEPFLYETILLRSPLI